MKTKGRFTMTKFAKSLVLSATILSVALPGIAFAQSAEVTGRVKDVFENQFVLESDGQRLLVTPSEGTAMPSLHTTVAVTGTREGSNVAATAIDTLSGQRVSVDEVNLPEDLRGLGLTNIRDREDDDRERRIGGRLADGSELRVEYDRQGRINEVETNRDGTLPVDLLTRILPAALLETPEYKGIARVTQVEFDENEVQIEGYSADGAKIEIDASPAGEIFSFERKTDRKDRRAMNGDAAQERMASLGYTVLDSGERDDGVLNFTATNPYGERVAVRLDDQGRVTREAVSR